MIDIGKDPDDWSSGGESRFLRISLCTAIAAEYNRKYNRGFLQDQNQTGLSYYFMYDLNERLEIFGRYDRLSSNTIEMDIDPWNLQKDGSYAILGLEFEPIEGVKLALNFREWFPSDPGMANAPFIFLNLEVSL